MWSGHEGEQHRWILAWHCQYKSFSNKMSAVPSRVKHIIKTTKCCDHDVVSVCRYWKNISFLKPYPDLIKPSAWRKLQSSVYVFPVLKRSCRVKPFCWMLTVCHELCLLQFTSRPIWKMTSWRRRSKRWEYHDTWQVVVLDLTGRSERERWKPIYLKTSIKSWVPFTHRVCLHVLTNKRRSQIDSRSGFYRSS